MRIILSAEQAIDCLPKCDDIHVFTNPGGMLIGADWRRKDIVETINNAEKIEIGGPVCRGTGHGLVVFPKNAKYQSDLYFVQSDDGKLKKYDKDEKSEEGQ